MQEVNVKMNKMLTPFRALGSLLYIKKFGNPHFLIAKLSFTEEDPYDIIIIPSVWLDLE